ncbi:PaaI family thioesterase [Marinicrinis lubricantis]|uniref:PaaI family thioesterase n=1 Tax=Marinicrinis lubricantis TaxID=2086470 RepID=A0ABW1IL74_9BACL
MTKQNDQGISKNEPIRIEQMDIEAMEQWASSTFWGYIGCKLKHADKRSATLYLEIEPHHLNVMGILHGGVISTLIDNCMGIAAMMARPGEKVVTSHLNLHFLAQAEGSEIWTYANIVHETRKSLTIEAQVKDKDGRRLAMATGTFRSVGPLVK